MAKTKRARFAVEAFQKGTIKYLPYLKIGNVNDHGILAVSSQIYNMLRE